MASALISVFGPPLEADHTAAADGDRTDSESSSIDSHPPPLVSVRPTASPPWAGSTVNDGSAANDDSTDDCPPLERLRNTSSSLSGGEILFESEDDLNNNDEWSPPLEPSVSRPSVSGAAAVPLIPEEGDEDDWTDEDDNFEGGQHAHVHHERRSAASFQPPNTSFGGGAIPPPFELSIVSFCVHCQ
jgi:hypothetical protein